MISINCKKYIFCLLASSFICTQSWADTVSLNFRDADIRAVVESAAEITGRSFVLDQRVKGNITIVSPGEIEADLFYEAILSALHVTGYQAVDDGAITRIIPINQSFVAPSGVAGGELQTKVIPLNHVAATEVLPTIKLMLTKQALATAYAAGNYLILTDTKSQISKAERILADIDSPNQSSIDVISLEHIASGEAIHIATQLRQFQDQQLSVVEDSINNRVIVSGSRTGRASFKRFIRDLDVPAGSQQGGVEVIYLNYASAEEIQPILEGMLQSETFLRLAGERGGEGAAEGNFTIQADVANNAIVIAASASIISEVHNVVRKLDRRRPQVLIEAIIASVSENVARDITSEVATVGRNTGAIVSSFGSALTSVLGALGTSIANDTNFDTNSLGGAVSPGVSGGFGGFDSSSGTGWALLINAIASDNDSNILSTPSVLTLDNEEASLSVGQEVPFVTGSFTDSNNASTNPFQTIQREEVGVVLTVTPQINDASSVQLEIAQEISGISTQAVAGVADIVTDKSTITTSVMVEDGQLLVLGGLMRDAEIAGKSKVPILGDIPLLGLLFRDSTKSADQEVLMMFIRPTIIRNPEDAQELSTKKYDYLRAYQTDPDGKGDVGEDILKLLEPVPLEN